MKRYASLGISKARYDDSRTRIVKVEAYEIRSGNLGTRMMMPREQLVDAVRIGPSVTTIHVRDGCFFDLLDSVTLVETEDGTLLRAGDERDSRDDLGELPQL